MKARLIKQTLVRKPNPGRCPKYDLVIVDEAHRAASRSHRDVIEQACHQETLLCGFTATPNRSDGIGLSKIFDEIVYEYIRSGSWRGRRGQGISL